MINYLRIQFILGILGSLLAAICGLIFIIDGIKFYEPKEILIGLGAIVAGVIGITLSIIFLKKCNIDN